MKLEVNGPTIRDTPVIDLLPPRHCGRCQCAFPGDPTLFFQTDWALCPACTAILLPRRPVETSLVDGR